MLLHMISQVDRSTPVLFLDTGFLFPETLDYQRELTFLLGLSDVRILRPNTVHEGEFDPAHDLHGTHPNVCRFFRKVGALEEWVCAFFGMDQRAQALSGSWARRA